MAEELPPRILIATPVKNAVAHLPRYFDLLQRIDHDPARIALGFLESDSTDGTYGAIADRLDALRRRHPRVTLLRHDFGFHPTVPRGSPEIQRRRRSILARARNRLIAGALQDEEWVLWLDADLVDYPADLPARLIAAEKSVVVPLCVRPDGTVFDMNTFCIEPPGRREDRRHLRDGILQPPPGTGRRYLDGLGDRALVPVDGVGGTVLLVRADLHREGLNFPAFSLNGYIETEGLAQMARAMGVQAWGMPGVRVVHAAT